MFGLLKVLEEANSPINGKIQIVKTLEGTRILVGGISQSGWLVKKVWKTALDRIKKDRTNAKQILVLGLGGGSAVEIIQKYWPDAKITGVDIDPLMVNFGKKYLNLGRSKNLKIVEADAEKWVRSHARIADSRFDLVLVDLYIGSKIPKQFRQERFIKGVASLIHSGGVAAFNHLYSASEREDAHSLESKLGRVFPVVKSVAPEANIIFLCFKD